MAVKDTMAGEALLDESIVGRVSGGPVGSIDQITCASSSKAAEAVRPGSASTPSS